MTDETTEQVAGPERRRAPLAEVGRRVTGLLVAAKAAGKAGLPTRRWELAAYGGLLLMAAGMRLYDLGSRAMHHDESLHAFYAWNLSIGNGYAHNPLLHGPFQMEGTAAMFLLFGDSDFTARLLYAVAGTVLVALPFFFRARLGRLGALFVSIMLAFSPTMLYFSRFARNDILMAAWTLGLVICMWRYVDEGKNRYLYLGAALLALAFSTKETAYILTVTLGLFLVVRLTASNWPEIRARVAVGEVSPPAALARLGTGAWSVLVNGVKTGGTSREAGFLVLLFTLSLPLGAALVGMLQETALLSWSNLVLVNDDPCAVKVNEVCVAPVGAALRGGIVIAFLVALGLVLISVNIGRRRNLSAWWRYALIFAAVWLLVQTTFLSNPAGILSGGWQALGYWLVQQGEARGGQPWFYYPMIASVYEFLPLLLAAAGSVYYLRRNDPFGHFLVFWVAITLILYTTASEKMPWLLVNITLPLIVLSGRYLGELVEGIEWRRALSGGGPILLGAVPLALVLIWRLAFYDPGEWGLAEVLVPVTAVGVLIALAYLAFRIARRIGRRHFIAAAAVPVVLILLALSVRSAWYASYRNGDTPVEILVYTQTSPDIARLARELRQSDEGPGLPITLDGSSGFHWPWWWYLRGYTSVGYANYDETPLQDPPDSSVLLVHERNRSAAETVLGDGFNEGIRIKHRWWFPENYKSLTVGKVLRGLADRESWRAVMDYFFYRELAAPLGSEDAFLYISSDFGSDFEPLP